MESKYVIKPEQIANGSVWYDTSRDAYFVYWFGVWYSEEQIKQLLSFNDETFDL